MLVVVALIDESTSTIEDFYTFENIDIAWTKLRRTLRSSFLKGEVDKDWIDEHCFAYVGDFNNGFYDKHSDEEYALHGYKSANWTFVNCRYAIDDLVVDGDEVDNS